MPRLTALWFFIAILAVWRLTHLLHAEIGPWKLFARLRQAAGSAFHCFACLSLWIALPAAALLAGTWIEGACLTLALSGGAILLQRATEARPPNPTWTEAPPETDYALKEETL